MVSSLVVDRLSFDGGRQVSAHVPEGTPELVVFAADGQLVVPWAGDLQAAGAPPTLVVGAERAEDETGRLHEYSSGFDPARFDAHEHFFVEDLRAWTTERFGVALPRERTAVMGVSAGGELALALGLRHSDLYGLVFCASPGAGYRPPQPLPSSLPRTYFVAGTGEPFFRDNATRWADTLRAAGADVVQTERPGRHGGGFWRRELPLMIQWALGRSVPHREGSPTGPLTRG